MSSFESLGLLPKLVSALKAKGYAQPTPIQAKAIPAVLEGRDVMGGSQTGTGKTAAFALPIIQHQFQHRSKGTAPRALVLAPTRELAAQVEESFQTYSRGLGVYSAAVFGGVGMGPQVSKLRRGVGVVVATPGRLLDHVSGRTIDLSRIEVFVLDEADRMLDMGFLPDIKRIFNQLPEERQNLMFSATYSGEIRRLAEGLLQRPLSIEVARRNTAAESVAQLVHPVARPRKRELLSALIKGGDWEQVLVFARTRHGAERLSKQLTKDGVKATAIHGDKTQGARTRALEQFKRGKVCVLVATDVASRGIDIRALPHVVNFDLPEVPEDYVHRIGRTGRAGEEGCAVSLVSREESEKLAGIEKLLGKTIPRETVAGFEGEELGRPAAVTKKAATRSRDASKRPAKSPAKKKAAGAKKKAAGPKKARPGETAADRRKRKPKWSAARKRAARKEREGDARGGGKRRR